MSIAKLRSRLSKAETNLHRVLGGPRRDIHQACFAHRRVEAARGKLAEALRHAHAALFPGRRRRRSKVRHRRGR